MTTFWVLVTILALMILGMGWLVWRLVAAAEYKGEVKGRNEALELNIENRRAKDAIETEVNRMSDADVTKRLSKYKRPF